MSRREETLVKWDKDKKWEELYLFFGIVIHRKEIKSVFVDPEGYIEAQPGVRYFLSHNGGSKQSKGSEFLAMCISFLFTGIIPFMIILAFVAWYSVRARSNFTVSLSFLVLFALSFLTLLIPVKIYDINVLRWKVWDCLFDYFS